MENKTIKIKKSYPIIDVPASGKPDWYEGAFTLLFVYSRNAGNFILRGYRGEVDAYLKKNYTHYFCYKSMWHHGQTRGHWNFWKDSVGIFEPSRSKKGVRSKNERKYTIRPYSGAYGHEISMEELREKTIILKRLPKHWIPEFNKL